MTRDTNHMRRRFTALTATAALSTALAGCSGSGGDAASAAAADGDDATTAESTAEPATESSDTTGGDDGSGDGSAPQFDGWFDNVDNYDGVADATGQSTVTVTVGSQANGGVFGFSPAAVRVDSGTTVVREWNSKGGSHNVAAADGTFESELTGSSGHTFEHTFEAAGAYTYACTPHKAVGMKGAIVVEWHPTALFFGPVLPAVGRFSPARELLLLVRRISHTPRTSVLAAARRRPSLTFVLAGGALALWYVLAEPVVVLLTDGDPAIPSGPVTVLVAGGLLGGGLLASLLWRRLGGPTSRLRGVLVGGLVGLLALPVPMYLLEPAVVVMEGSLFEAPAGMGPVAALVRSVALFLVAPLFLGVLSVIATLGGTAVVGTATGPALAWE